MGERPEAPLRVQRKGADGTPKRRRDALR